MTRLAGTLLVALLVMPFQPAASRTVAPAMTAAQLVAKVVGSRDTNGFGFRATLTRTIAGSNVKQIRHLLIKGRRHGTRATVLYQQLWPQEGAGRALVVEDTGDHQLRGFDYQSGRVTRLTARMLGDPFFESDLSLEDMVEGFWYWPERTITGQEAIEEYRCAIVAFRPGPDTATAYSLVKTWVSFDLAVGLRIEQFGRNGRLVKRIGMYRVLKVDKRWLPTIATVEPADGRSRSVFEGTKILSGLHLSAADFSVAAIKRSARAPD